MEASPGEVTQLLAELKRGNEDVLAKLIPVVYPDLRRLAATFLRDEREGHTLQPTALVHEAYLRLTGQAPNWRNRAQFMGVAAHLMRRILVDYARRRIAAKRGGGQAALEIDTREPDPELGPSEELLVVEESMERLAKLDPQQARVVEMRYFGGMTVEETADALSISVRTVKREWAMAKAWLRVEISSKAAT